MPCATTWRDSTFIGKCLLSGGNNSKCDFVKTCQARSYFFKYLFYTIAKCHPFIKSLTPNIMKKHIVILHTQYFLSYMPTFSNHSTCFPNYIHCTFFHDIFSHYSSTLLLYATTISCSISPFLPLSSINTLISPSYRPIHNP